MLAPNLFLRQVASTIKVPTLTVGQLSQLKLFPDEEDDYKLCEKLAEQETFRVEQEGPEVLIDCFEWLMADVNLNGKKIEIQKVLGPDDGIYQMRWSSTSRMVFYSPPDDTLVLWCNSMRCIGFRSSIDMFEENQHGEWASAEMHFFLMLDDARQWKEIQIKLDANLFSGTELARDLDQLLMAQALYKENPSRTQISPDLLARLSKFCMIPRTESHILGLTLPLEKQDIDRISGLLQLGEEHARIFRNNWEIAVRDGMLVFATQQLADVAVRSEFNVKIRRPSQGNSHEIAQWEIDATMMRKDTGGPAMRHSPNPFTHPDEVIVDMDAVEILVSNLVEAVHRLNDDALWACASRRLSELRDELGMSGDE
ncbi:MAG: hypothetical protein O3A36_01030 [bacterium]|nr:hypothetical protein [bacterium]